MYDDTAGAYVNDSTDVATYSDGDLLCSVAGQKPISGKLSGIGSKMNLNSMAANRGAGWMLSSIKAECANLLLMMMALEFVSHFLVDTAKG